MSRKWRRIAEGKPEPVPQSTVDALKRRRKRRLIFVGLVGLSFPILEVIAYRFRTITMTIDNRTVGPITNLQVTYPGGSFEEPEIKPGGESFASAPSVDLRLFYDPFAIFLGLAVLRRNRPASQPCR